MLDTHWTSYSGKPEWVYRNICLDLVWRISLKRGVETLNLNHTVFSNVEIWSEPVCSETSSKCALDTGKDHPKVWPVSVTWPHKGPSLRGMTTMATQSVRVCPEARPTSVTRPSKGQPRVWPHRNPTCEGPLKSWTIVHHWTSEWQHLMCKSPLGKGTGV